MRPRHLQLSAFGPFADTVEVDFDRLADTGLFVVAGPTGAGKTSLFDGVCFALYGRLAGHRDHHSDVRSDHAHPDRPTEVTFEFDAGGGRWRVWRHPRQERPKRRGRGLTVDGPRARLERWEGNGWRPVESRWEPVNQRCRQLVGLDVDQFQQVVLLPQGRFQDVLNARSADRQALLRTLFRSQRYQRGQELLDQWAKELGERLGSVESQRREQLERARHAMAEAVHALTTHDITVSTPVPVPPASGDDGSDDAAPGLGEAFQALGQGPVQELRRRRRAADVTAAGSARLASLARETAQLVERRADLRRARAELDEQAPRWAATAEALRRAQRAAPVRQAAAAVTARRHDLDEAQAVLARRWSRAEGACRRAGIDVPAEPDHDTVEHARLDAEMRAKLMGELAELLAAAASLEHTADQAAAERSSAAEEHQELEQRRARVADRLRRLAAEREQLAGRAAELPHRQRRRDELRRRATLRRELLDLDAARARRTGELVRLDAHRQDLDAQLSRQQAERDDTDRVAGGLGEATELVERRRHQLDRWRAAATARVSLEQADAAVTRARAQADAALARFIGGTAPRLAARLVAGEPCPVCGSAEHPDPAASAPEGPPVDGPEVERAAADAAAAEERRTGAAARYAHLVAELGPLAEQPEDQLRRAWDEARQAQVRCRRAQDRVEALDEELARLQRERASTVDQRDDGERRRVELTDRRSNLLGALGSDADTDPSTLAAEADRAAASVVEAERAADGLDQLSVERDRLVDQDQRDHRRIDELVRASARWDQQEQDARSRAAALRADVRAAAGAADPAELADRAVRAANALGPARQAVAARDVAAGGFEAALATCQAAVSTAGFRSLDEALTVALPTDEIEHLDEALRAWQRRDDEVRAVLAALDAQRLPDEPPDVEQLEAAAAAARQRSADLAELAGQVSTQLDQASRCLDQVAAGDAQNRELQDRVRLARSAAQVVRGRNSRNVALEAWVLAAHLREVVDHANQHLAGMSGGRYQLLVSDSIPDGRSRSGLDLAVDDAFTGSTRPTVSLSGGETFQASLALALGLADVVTAGRAGLQLDVLFIDEGFGSLDADSLDQAIDVLDGLRSRGALVGVVTHVESMKNALPVAIEVRPRPDRRGSTVHQAA